MFVVWLVIYEEKKGPKQAFIIHNFGFNTKRIIKSTNYGHFAVSKSH